jgi:hypothetical protein
MALNKPDGDVRTGQVSVTSSRRGVGQDVDEFAAARGGCLRAVDLAEDGPGSVPGSLPAWPPTWLKLVRSVIAVDAVKGAGGTVTLLGVARTAAVLVAFARRAPSRRACPNQTTRVTASPSLRQYRWYMHREPEPGELPIAASQALARLLSRENRVSDLIAFLAGLDSESFLAALGLPLQEVRVKREDLLGKRETGTADLVVRGESGPIALLEIKVSAAQHGNQFERYDNWARVQATEPKCYLVALDGEALSPPLGWAVEPLPRLFRCWRDSRNPHAAWLGSAAAAVLEGWVTQADGRLGNATGSVVGDLIARRIAVGLAAHGDLGMGLEIYPTTTFGAGAAMVLAHLPFPDPSREPGTWLCADFRSKARDRPGAPWQLRLGIEVEINDHVTAAQARTTAHDLAMSIREALTCTAVRQALRQAAETELATALRPRPSSSDRLGTLDEATLKEWRADVQTRTDSGHPLLVHDNIHQKKYRGYRLASLIEIDVSDLHSRQLTTLVRIALTHIEEHAFRHTAKPSSESADTATQAESPTPL